MKKRRPAAPPPGSKRPPAAVSPTPAAPIPLAPALDSPAPASPAPRSLATAPQTSAPPASAGRTRSYGDPEVTARLRELVARYGTTDSEDLVLEQMFQALKLVRDGADRAELKITTAAARELRRAFGVFRRYRRVPKITVFGSARTQKDAAAYRAAVEFGRRMAAHGFMIITGAGPGIMEAALEGAGRERSFGVNIRLPHEQSANPVIAGDRKLVSFRYFFTRKLAFMREACAIVLFPGGFGTLDEGFEALTLVQTGKAQLMPVVCVDSPGGTYWRGFDEYLKRHLLEPGYIDRNDLSLYRVTDDVGVACDEIMQFYRRYRSQRYVGKDLVMRLASPLPPEALARLNEQFADIVTEGEIRAAETSAEELASEPALAALPRLRMNFDRRSFGRLRQLIDEINRA
jgi:uncharacterized protein (TIGR00730 family)